MFAGFDPSVIAVQRIYLDGARRAVDAMARPDPWMLTIRILQTAALMNKHGILKKGRPVGSEIIQEFLIGLKLSHVFLKLLEAETVGR